MTTHRERALEPGSGDGETPRLFSPLTIRGVTLPNRIMVSPMCQYSAEEGFANDWHLVNLGTRAVGGAGLVMTETVAVERDGRISPWDLGIWDDRHIEMLSRIAGFIAGQGSVPAIQIGHAGRKASQRRPWEGGGPLTPEEGAWQTIAPSAVPLEPGWPVPAAMTLEDITRVIDSFRAAARRALRAGFKVLELHGAHGYLINSFLGEQSNRREDAYGGSFENRSRFALEVVEAVRQEWPEELPLFMRISATDWAPGGWGYEHSVALARELAARGVDVIDASSGGNVSGVTIPNTPGYQVPGAEAIRQGAGVLTVAVGLITEPEHAEAILAEGKADIIALGRELLRNPYWPLQAAAKLGADHPWPPQYLRAKR